MGLAEPLTQPADPARYRNLRRPMTVPPQDGAGGDQPVRSQPCRQERDQRGENRSVGPVEPGPRMGTAQHRDLVPQHEQLSVLAGCRPAEQDQPAAEPDEDELEQAQRTRMIMMPYGWTLAIAAAHRSGGLLAPHRCPDRLPAWLAVRDLGPSASLHTRSICPDARCNNELPGQPGVTVDRWPVPP
jgi:hypothetical protein